jgi:dimethylglycine catabolism A
LSIRYPLSAAPIRIGSLELRNRVFVPAHTTNYGEAHAPTERHLEYHRARARGGAALIIFESIRVARNTLGRPQGVGGFDRRTIPMFARIAQAVQGAGARLVGQVIHLGRQIEGDFERTVSVGPSAVAWSPTAALPHAMHEDDMGDAIEAHIVTAKNLIEAGFDGIELQVGHGHLLQQFLSPLSNQREDRYGGSEANRMRFPIAVLQAVRAALGSTVPIGIRFSGSEFVEGGLTVADAVSIVPKLLAATALDFVHVSHSAYHMSYSLATQFADMHFDPAPFRDMTRRIRAATTGAGYSTPILAVCKFRSMAEAEVAIAEGVADMVGFARAHIAEPELVAKSFAGRESEIRPCIGCNQGCAGMLEKNLAITCVVNPATGREFDWGPVSRVKVPRHVVVIGGGPAGSEAAITAAAHGHRVTLIERDARLGGQLNWMNRIPARRDWLTLLTDQRQRLAASGVAIQLGTAASIESIAALAPEVVVLATGSRPVPVNVAGGARVFTIEAALADQAALGERVAFHDSTGEWASIGVIEHLAASGKAVTVFTPTAGFGWRATIYSTLAVRKRLRDMKVRIVPFRALREWNGDTLILEDTTTGEPEQHSGFTSLVAARYNIAQDALYAPLRAKGFDVRLIGDCLAPRTALEAIYEGHALARELS